jgi:hypothetical protein
MSDISKGVADTLVRQKIYKKNLIFGQDAELNPNPNNGTVRIQR